ncbi:response regulator [Phormidium sp. FACHB-592]|uniref:Response regulator n=1 Tax=Stenomitos frigidus AS-A4 TaxID=2933935 RepID=A0ABV0KSG5_9CYAN|nr:response regulator [Phormidium sp. FACHB-592]MBD2075160.1 response regulator [Phormidium sp. FACHB-592]
MQGNPSERPPKADRILVVDDLPDNCFLLQTMLKSEGYQVEVADSGPAALHKITTCPPDLVLLDVMMPGMDGFEVTRQLRHDPALPFIPVLLVTGHSDPEPADGFDAGADDFVRKPIDFDLLLNRIRAILQPVS